MERLSSRSPSVKSHIRSRRRTHSRRTKRGEYWWWSPEFYWYAPQYRVPYSSDHLVNWRLSICLDVALRLSPLIPGTGGRGTTTDELHPSFSVAPWRSGELFHFQRYFQIGLFLVIVQGAWGSSPWWIACIWPWFLCAKDDKGEKEGMAHVNLNSIWMRDCLYYVISHLTWFSENTIYRYSRWHHLLSTPGQTHHPPLTKATYSTEYAVRRLTRNVLDNANENAKL